MTDPMHQQLLGHLLGALDDDEQEWLETRLDSDEEYRRHCLLWRRRLALIEAMRPEFEPPPGLAERTCRLVAACAPAMAHAPAAALHCKMSPEAAFPARAAAVAWCDVAAVTLLVALAVALIFPAIYSSRFQARLTACQDNLRQFGLALAAYSHQHGDALSRLASGGRLTTAGVSAAGLIQDGFASDGHRALCPDAWLAAQDAIRRACNVAGTLRVPSANVAGTNVAGTLRVPSAFFPFHFARFGAPLRNLGPQSRGVFDSDPEWPGTWRNGTPGGEQEPTLPAALPLLADAPSADMPGQAFDAHDGRGRNVFFADGAVRFLPSPVPADAAEIVLSGDSSSVPGSPTPVTYVNWH